jgi:hypothetical protein
VELGLTNIEIRSLFCHLFDTIYISGDEHPDFRSVTETIDNKISLVVRGNMDSEEAVYRNSQNIKGYLFQNGYSHFKILFNSSEKAFEIIDTKDTTAVSAGPPATFEEKVDLWAKKSIEEDRDNEENIKEAARIIKYSYSQKVCTFIDLSRLSLRSLPDLTRFTRLESLLLHNNKLTTPPDLSKCTRLERLDLAYNKLTTPPDLSKCTRLERLDLAYNELTRPPDLSECTRLQWIRLHNNKLTTPPDLTRCTQLKWVRLSNNRLTSPPDLSKCTQLESLLLRNNELTHTPDLTRCTRLEEISFNHNPNLQELHISTGLLPGVTHIGIRGTRISQPQRDTLLANCRRLRGNGAHMTLPLLISLWKTYSGLDFDSKFIDAFTNIEKTQLHEWLVRLAKTKDFSSAQVKLANLVCQMLESLRASLPFKETFFSQVSANLTNCDDRAAMAFNEIFVSWKICHLPAETPIEEKILLLIGAAKTLALRCKLTSCIEKHEKKTKSPLKESVETFLYYETTLREPLGLLTAIESMSYSSMGKRKWISEDDLGSSVMRNWFSYILEIPAFNVLIEKDEGYRDFLKELSEKQMQRLEGAQKDSDEKKLPKGKSYNDVATEIQGDFERERAPFILEWIERNQPHPDSIEAGAPETKEN